MITQTTLPYSEYLLLPEDDHTKYEMLWGELHMAASPRYRHQDVQIQLGGLLNSHVRKRGLGAVVGPVDLYRDEMNYVQPDLSYFTAEQHAALADEHAIRLIPPLVAEILSPGSSGYDRVKKRRWYAELGVREYWIADAFAGRVEVIDLVGGTSRGADLVRSSVLPELALPLAEIFVP